MQTPFEIELSDLTEDAVRRLLKDAIKQRAINSLPAGRRAKARRERETCDCCGKAACDCDCDDSTATADMNRGGVRPNLPGVTSADLPPGTRIRRQGGRRHGKGP